LYKLVHFLFVNKINKILNISNTQEIPQELQARKGSDVPWKKVEPTNYKLVPLRDDNYKHLVLFDEDQCLWSCNRARGETAYLCCTDERPGEKRDCPARAVITKGVFKKISSSSHNHLNNHNNRALGLLKYSELKRSVFNQRRTNVRDIWRKWARELTSEQKPDYRWDRVRSALYVVRSSVLPPCPTQRVLADLLANNKEVNGSYGMHNNKRFYQGVHGGSFFFIPEALIGEEPLTGDFTLTQLLTSRVLTTLKCSS
jgi:hypothetical protein